MKTVLSLACFVVALAALPAPSAAESPDDILVIANTSLPVSAVNPVELKDFFLRKKTAWQSGDTVVPVHATSGSRLRADFCTRVLGMSANEEKLYWKAAQIRTGQESPASFANTLKAVFKLRGSVSYIYRADYREGVAKVLLVLPSQ